LAIVHSGPKRRRHERPGSLRARPYRRLAPPLVRFTPDLLTYSAPLFLKRRCDRTSGLRRVVPGLFLRELGASALAESCRHSACAAPRRLVSSQASCSASDSASASASEMRARRRPGHAQRASNVFTWHKDTIRPAVSLCHRLPPRPLTTRTTAAKVGLSRAVGLYPIVTLQYSSTASYQVSYHIQYLFF
jgi:hypothetical protein